MGEARVPSRKEIWIECVVILAAFYVPSLASVYVSSGYTTEQYRAAAWYSAVTGASKCIALGFILFKLAPQGFGLVRPRWKDLLSGAGVGIGIGVVSAVFTPLSAAIVHWTGAPTTYRALTAIGIGYAAPFTAFLTLFEELLFRSYLVNRLIQAQNSPTFAVIVSSALFASYHIYQGVAVLPGVFAIGCFLGMCMVRMKNVTPLYIGHLLYDLVVFAIGNRH